MSSTEPLPGNQTRSTLVQSLNDFNKPQPEIQQHERNIIANDNEDDSISPHKITTSKIEDQRVRDDITNEFYIPLSSTIVLKRKKEMLYVLQDYEKGLTIDAIVDSGVYVSAIAQTDIDRIKQQVPAKIFKFEDPPNFQIQVENGQLEKPISTATLKFDIRDNTFPEHFVVMKSLTGRIIELHFMRHNSVVIDTTYGLIHFPRLTMQAKKPAIETTAKSQPVLVQDNTKDLQLLLIAHQNGLQQVR